jgi:hypothetical protein
LRLPKLRLEFLSLVARGLRRKSRTTRKSTQLIGEITKITDITEIASSSPQIKKTRGLSIALMMQRSGARSIAPQDTIWKSVKIFWIARRCHHQQHWWPRSPVGANTARPILLTTMNNWERSM